MLCVHVCNWFTFPGLANKSTFCKYSRCLIDNTDQSGVNLTQCNMQFSKEEIDIETLCADTSEIRLESSSSVCEVCKIGAVVPVGRETQLVLYTRSGTRRGVHVEKRCNNRSTPCRVGHYYGYVKTAEGKVIDSEVLKNDFLITSNQTAFAVDYLWDSALQILFNRAIFEGLANVYNNLNYKNITMDAKQKRETVVCKRIAEAFYMYAYIEIGQRYNIEMTIPRTLEEAILEQKSALHDAFRLYWTKESIQCKIKIKINIEIKIKMFMICQKLYPFIKICFGKSSKCTLEIDARSILT